MVSARAFAVGHIACRHRIWFYRSPHHLRCNRCEVLDLQRRNFTGQETRTAAGRRVLVLKVWREAECWKLRADSYVDAKESEVPQAAARAHDREGVAREP